MAKAKGPPGVQNRHIYNRASYMYQAATYLASQQHRPSPNVTTKSSSVGGNEHSAQTESKPQNETMQNMSRQMLSSMRAVTLKGQIRQSPALKRTICKFCDTLMVEGQTCTSIVENASKGGRKPWADVLKIKCNSCGNSKRYPVGTQRQKRRSLRQQEQRTVLEEHSENQSVEKSDEKAASAT
ncbi:RNAse P Rpr2/Rpp21/SNM1 subunit domain-containing protein [Thelonectria olida]|uniref:RNAse P Rpr2/Rpp21/SNM1 subunit domain-containing protein n=1 Tax=Thelonectria olida TaxID=1576542 RepID=A0A9P9ANI9_9HYPO|nr:RNAse P Rpr2/Rpp21/SNM1 subunit domain-containing protein [Thelonectria olida]